MKKTKGKQIEKHKRDNKRDYKKDLYKKRLNKLVSQTYDIGYIWIFKSIFQRKERPAIWGVSVRYRIF